MMKLKVSVAFAISRCFDMGNYVKLVQRYENVISSIYSLQFKKKNGGFKRMYISKLLGYFDAIYLRFIRLCYRDFQRIIPIFMV